MVLPSPLLTCVAYVHELQCTHAIHEWLYSRSHSSCVANAGEIYSSSSHLITLRKPECMCCLGSDYYFPLYTLLHCTINLHGKSLMLAIYSNHSIYKRI